ncbi:unnamed protein product, partial [Staurois parvus]
MPLPLVASGKNAPSIGGQWEECPLHCWSVGRMSLTLGVSGKNVPYICDQWEECPLHWWSVGRMSLTLGVSGKNAPYIGGKGGILPTDQQCKEHSSCRS